MALPPSLTSRVQGSIYGLAACDALGSPVEFRRRGSFPLVTKYRYNANFDLPSGSWTDDTSMTLCLAQSIVSKTGRFEVLDQVNNYVKWFNEGYLSSSGSCFDIGNATRIACSIWQKYLTRQDATAEVEGQREIDASLNHEQSCGNGSLMRTAPIALAYYAKRNQEVDEYTARAGKVTHPHATCIGACQLYVRLICTMLRTHEQLAKNALFDELKEYSWSSTVLKATFGKYSSLEDLTQAPESAISSSGFVMHTLEAALWAFFTTNNFKDGALKVVNLGDDADTVGAVYGGFAGAYYGIEEIPAEWVEGLQRKGTVDEVVQRLTELVSEKDR